MPGGGAPPKPSGPLIRNTAHRCRARSSAIRAAIVPQMRTAGAAPVRVKLVSKAAAKSHRPEHLFSAQSCPIVSGGSLGELFVKATPEGLDRLTEIIEHNTSDRMTKELSCVETIEPVTPAYRRSGLDAADVLRNSPRGKNGFITRVGLFNFGADRDQPKLVADLEAACKRREIALSARGYSPSSFTYEAECRTVDDVEALSRVVGVRSIAPMPLIRTIRPRMFAAKPLPPLPTAADVTGDFPVVVVVDSGIASTVPGLESWVAGRDSEVAPAYRNTDHGTFVAGLICWGSQLNPTIAGLDDSPCGVYDLQVIPNDDPAKGSTLPLFESEFLQTLDEALQQNANKYKVWNLSLGTSEVCSLDKFSELAEELDNLQEKYQVSFVISAGNYDTPPLLDYPAHGQAVEGRENYNAGRQRPWHHGRGGIACGLQSQRTERALPVGVLAARRGAELRDQARPDPLWRRLHNGRLAHFRHPLRQRNRLCRESRHELCDTAGRADAGANLPSGDADAVSRPGEGAAHAPCARSADIAARTGWRREFLRLRLARAGAVLPRVHTAHLDVGLRRRSPARLLPRME